MTDFNLSAYSLLFPYPPNIFFIPWNILYLNLSKILNSKYAKIGKIQDIWYKLRSEMKYMLKSTYKTRSYWGCFLLRVLVKLQIITPSECYSV